MLTINNQDEEEQDGSVNNHPETNANNEEKDLRSTRKIGKQKLDSWTYTGPDMEEGLLEHKDG